MPIEMEEAKNNTKAASRQESQHRSEDPKKSPSDPNRFEFLSFRVDTRNWGEPNAKNCNVASLQNPGYTSIAFSTTDGPSAMVTSSQYVSSFDVTADLIIDPANARELDLPCSKGHVLWFRAKLTLQSFPGGGPEPGLIAEAKEVDVEFISGGKVPCRAVAFEIAEGRIFGMFRFTSNWEWPDYKGITPEQLFQACQEISLDEVPLDRLFQIIEQDEKTDREKAERHADLG